MLYIPPPKCRVTLGGICISNIQYAEQKWAANVMNAARLGRRAAGIQRAGVQGWMRGMCSFILGRPSSGAECPGLAPYAQQWYSGAQRSEQMWASGVQNAASSRKWSTGLMAKFGGVSAPMVPASPMGF